MSYSLLLGILILTQGALFLLKPERRFLIARLIFIASVILIFGWQGYLSYRQYQVWSGNEFSQLWLPPHRSITYFFSYIFTNFFLKSLIVLGAALIFLTAVFFLNKKFQERFFEKEEPYLGALAIFLFGHPLWMFYVIAICGIGFFGTLILWLRSAKGYGNTNSYIRNKFVIRREPFSFYYFWLPTAILVLTIGKFLI